ncbi:hypothetical protein [Anaerocolumna sp. MB42-C2]|uniref:hypothetical protein n=1 Tax=Anaerocolumna sp. MB42-C2 TaxID=3070997 RepID=UPI0027DFE07D|nr:hypothetical protein [Anaerocolumna sp. MB42-C2]WMJ88885.1 hypothetical protein RBU59_05035 [Anaerocolumna sp. MB42-C2]
MLFKQRQDIYTRLGFYRYCGFIQIVEINNSKDKVKIVDTPPIFQEKKIPFFSYGYPAEAYDAPVNSYGMGKELIWSANTYLVDMPSYVNGNQIRYLTGFSWGFQENSDKIEIIQLKKLSQIDWEYDVEFLKHEYNEWSFM